MPLEEQSCHLRVQLEAELRGPDLLLSQVHFAEEWNELHHLQIMESLGGDQFWVDRFMAQHAAVFYYWVLIAFFAFFPSLAYMFSELVEASALPLCES